MVCPRYIDSLSIIGRAYVPLVVDSYSWKSPLATLEGDEKS